MGHGRGGEDYINIYREKTFFNLGQLSICYMICLVIHIYGYKYI